MKRKLALILLMLLAVSVVLVACNTAQETKVEVRWKSNETHVFHVSLADFAGTASSSTFKTYNANGDADLTGKYRKDKAMSGEGLFAKDEIVPNAVCGTYTLTISTTAGEGETVVEGKQVLYVQYLLDSTVQNEIVDLRKCEDWDVKVSDEEAEANTHLDWTIADSIILKSETTTKATFKDPSQQPISSSTVVNGFYLGKDNQELNKYSLSTVYNFDDAKKPIATVTVNDQVNNVVDKVTKYTLARNASSNLIDANQLLLYVRSLGKTSSSLQDGKSISVFNPLTGSTQTASFGLSYEDNVILTDSEGMFGTTLNSVTVSVGGIAFMVQDNVPGTIKQDEILLGVDNLPRYSTIHFRVGYLSYEIDYSNELNTSNWGEILEALKPAPVEPEEPEVQE